MPDAPLEWRLGGERLIAMNEYAFSWPWLSERIDAAVRPTSKAEAVERAASLRTFLSFFAAPEYSLFNPSELLLFHSASFLKAHRELFTEPVSDCAGAPELILALLGIVADAFALEEDAALVFEVCEIEDHGAKIPRIGLGLSGPGHFHKHYFFNNSFRMAFEEIAACWTLATRGGRIDLTENGMDLRLRGMRMPPTPLPEVHALIETLDTMPPQAALQTIYDGIAGNRAPEAAEIKTLTEKTLADWIAPLQQASIHLAMEIPEALPPILLERREWRMMLRHMMEWALWVLAPAGNIALAVAYDAARRVAMLNFTLQTSHGAIRNTLHREAMLHAAAALGARVEWNGEQQNDKKNSGVVFLPDPAGRALDAWLPGWEGFAEGNRRMLRLLKSGGAPLPEDFVLNGVLGSELERLLWPHLQNPPARNIANEQAESTGHAPGGDAARRKKAMTQIARGKPKKEICAPAYAVELLWAFREDGRSRAALGLASSATAAIEKLCGALAASPPDHAASLRLLAAVIQENT